MLNSTFGSRAKTTDNGDADSLSTIFPTVVRNTHHVETPVHISNLIIYKYEVFNTF